MQGYKHLRQTHGIVYAVEENMRGSDLASQQVSMRAMLQSRAVSMVCNKLQATRNSVNTVRSIPMTHSAFRQPEAFGMKHESIQGKSYKPNPLL